MPQSNLFDFWPHDEAFIQEKSAEVFDGRPDLQKDFASGLVHQRFHRTKDLISRMFFILAVYELMHHVDSTVHQDLFKKTLILASKLVTSSNDRVSVNYQITQICHQCNIDPDEII